jgi:hypothetical protein
MAGRPPRRLQRRSTSWKASATCSGPAAQRIAANFWWNPTATLLKKLDNALSSYAAEAALEAAGYSADEVALLVAFFERGSARRTRHAARLRGLTA